MSHTIHRRSSDTHVERDDVTLGRIVCHRVGADGLLGVLCRKAPHIELVPVATELLLDLVVAVLHLVLRDLDLGVATALEVHVLALRELDDKLFDEGSNVLIRNDFALPLLDAKDALRDDHLQILLDFGLTAETPVCHLLFAREEALLCGEDLSPTLYDTTATLSTATATATGTREEDAFVL